MTAKRTATVASCSRPGPFCRLISRTPGMPASGAKWRSGIERKRSRLMVGTALPGDADLEPATGPSSCRQWCDRSGIGEQVGDLGRDRGQGGPEEPRQAHQRGMDVELRERIPRGHHRRRYPGSSSAAGQRLRAATITCPPSVHQGRIADELQRVAQPCSAMEQDGSAVQGRAVPGRLAEEGNENLGTSSATHTRAIPARSGPSRSRPCQGSCSPRRNRAGAG